MRDLIIGSRELHESKSIDRSWLCQIQRGDNEQTIEIKSGEADRSDDAIVDADECGQDDQVTVLSNEC
jgi:hypothetical protein